MEEMFDNWDTPVPLPDMEKELKVIRKNLRRRNWKIVLTSVVLVIAILFVSVRYGIPALEKQYWDPKICTYLEDVTDLELTMATYTELFGYGRHFGTVDIQKQGFAKYSLDAVFLEWENMHSLTELFFRSGTLDQSNANLPKNFWLDAAPGFMIRSLSEYEDFIQGHNAYARAQLTALPEYIHVLASVTFSEDKTMEQIRDLKYTNVGSARYLWAVLRNDPDLDYYSRCGIHLTDYQYERYAPSSWNTTDYPSLFLDPNWTGSDMEQHVISMLRFSADQFQNRTGFSPSNDESYYQKTLDYMEENGIYAYGAYVFATPSALLEMLKDGTAAHIYLIDAQIGI